MESVYLKRLYKIVILLQSVRYKPSIALHLLITNKVVLNNFSFLNQ